MTDDECANERLDAELGARLKHALEPVVPPAHLSARVERMAALGLPARSPAEAARRARAAAAAPAFTWSDLLPALAGVPLLLGFLFGTGRFLLGALRDGSPVPFPVTLPELPTLPLPPLVAVVSLMLPLGVLLGVEALRGAPTLRRWLR